MNSLDHQTLRRAFGSFATGVCLVATYKDGSPIAITVNSFSSVSLEPPMILWCVQNQLSISHAYQACDQFSINVLSESQVDLSNIYSQEGKNDLALEHMDQDRSQVPLIKDALVQYVCVTDRTISCGDHTIVLGKVNEIYFCDLPGRPLLFHGGSYVSLDYSP